MRLKRELQLAEDQETRGGIYHVVSRVVWREFIFGEDEKVYFYSLMRKYEAFCGVQVQAVCLMSNHFHMMVYVPPKPTERMGDEEFFGTLALVYSGDVVAGVKAAVARARKNEEGLCLEEEIEALVDAVKAPYLRRMWDLSEFVKVIKQRFTRWYNRNNGKTGTLWEGRFRSQLVQAGYAAQMTAAYIDLNPVRAGMVSDPKDYRWCSYGEAVAGGKRARQGLLDVMNKADKGILVETDESLTWNQVMGQYRVMLAEEGVAVEQEGNMVEGESEAKRRKKRHGFSKEAVERIVESGGKLSWAELLRCKARYFSEGLVMGSRNYVDRFFLQLKERTGSYQKRQNGARKLRRVDRSERPLFIMRDLR